MKATPTTRWMRLLRRLGRDGNPLCRPEDTLAALIAPAALIIFLALAPLVAVLAAAWVHAGNTAVERAQKHWHSVEGVLIEPAPGPEMTSSGANLWTVWVLARWKVDGVTHRGDVLARAKSPAGSPVRIWLDRAGTVEAQPLSAAQLGLYAESAMAIALALLAMFLAALAWATWHVLERRRLKSWENAWLVIGPRWSRQA